MIKPSKENVKKSYREKLRMAFDSAYESGISIDRLIRLLNSIIRGWGKLLSPLRSKEDIPICH